MGSGKRQITLRAYEKHNDIEFCIVRLAGVGAGAAEAGEEHAFRDGKSLARVKVLRSWEKRFGDLTDEDAKLVLRPPLNGVDDLRKTLLELYRFRPMWAGDETILRFLQLRRVE